MPASDIQVIPRGLLGFLGIKNQGENPKSLPAQLSGVLDLSRWYMNACPQVERLAVTFIATALPTNQVLLTVPERELVYVCEANARGFNGPAGAFNISWSHQETIGGINVLVPFGDGSGPVTAPVEAYDAIRDVWLLPGERLNISGSGLGNVDLHTYVRFVRIAI